MDSNKFHFLKGAHRILLLTVNGLLVFRNFVTRVLPAPIGLMLFCSTADQVVDVLKNLNDEFIVERALFSSSLSSFEF